MSSTPKLRRRAGAGPEGEGSKGDDSSDGGKTKDGMLLSFVVPSFLGGLLMGCFIMYYLVDTATLASKTTGSANSNNNLRSLQQQQQGGGDDSANGWKDIHVFYGDKAGLGADPTLKTYAQVHQDEIVLDLLGTSGYFIDLAANDALQWTNTLLLERHEGWNGLCIEPNPTYWYGLSHRKCTVVGALMGGPQMEQVSVKFRGVFGGIVGKMDDGLANRKKEPKAKVEQRYTASLVDVLRKFDVPPTIDYLNLDIEGAEFMVMQHFPFDQYQIRVLTVERPNADLKSLLEKNGYIHLKDLAWWGETLWAHKSTGFSPEHPKIVKIITEGK